MEFAMRKFKSVCRRKNGYQINNDDTHCFETVEDLADESVFVFEMKIAILINRMMCLMVLVPFLMK